MSADCPYLLVLCQRGAEHALKTEIAREWPGFHLSYSRPGFVTFKWTGEPRLAADFDLRSAFARTYCFSLGRITGDHAETMASRVWDLVQDCEYDHLHVWQRDARQPGERGFEPGVTPLAREVADSIESMRPPPQGKPRRLAINRRAWAGAKVLDCVLVEPDEWWLGFHLATSLPSRFPGGVCLSRPRPEVISRAHWKTSEALTWSQLPVEKGDRCVEIGSAPGGSCQALLDAGLRVTGIDPAEMDETLLGHPRFTHVKMRAADVKRKAFRGVRWLMVDSNVAPRQSLDMIESIVTSSDVRVRGMLLSLKLQDWDLAERMPEYLDRVRSWGYRYVRARQLAFNRQEVCVAALRARSMRRTPPWKMRLHKQPSAGPASSNA